MALAKHLSKRDIEAVLDAVEPLIGFRPTRQTLYANHDIRDAYKYGLTEAKLNEPLPMIDRERTE